MMTYWCWGRSWSRGWSWLRAVAWRATWRWSRWSRWSWLIRWSNGWVACAWGWSRSGSRCGLKSLPSIFHSIEKCLQLHRNHLRRFPVSLRLRHRWPLWLSSRGKHFHIRASTGICTDFRSADEKWFASKAEHEFSSSGSSRFGLS